MTFLIDVVAEYLGRTLVWLTVESAVALVAAVAVIALLESRGRGVERTATVVIAIIGALVAASLVDRFDLPVALNLDVWRTPVPIIWSFGGAALAAVIAELWPRREAAAS